jgi:asparagine synthase (glutamine-hydrolysing)
MLKQFWSDGLFEELDERYFKLVNRAPLIGDEVNWENLEGYSAHKTFLEVFHSGNVSKESYFDLMTHFDFKTLLPALLQVEDRVSMANGIESRVPLLDHKIVEFAATIPADVKFKNGDMKHCLKAAMGKYLPNEILDRKDKMGFPVPLNKWMEIELRDFIFDIFSTVQAQNRDFIDNKKVLSKLNKETKFGRTIWGYLCIELWQREFHDNMQKYKKITRDIG